MDTWSEAWPTEPGFYWFFGWKFRRYPDDEKPKMRLVDVWRIANGLAYVVDGHFIYAADARGKWMRAELPREPAVMPDGPSSGSAP